MADEFWYLWYEYRGFRIFVIALLLGIVALLAWLLLLRDDGSGEAVPVQPGGGPAGVTEQDLITLSQELGQSIYWAGTIPGTRLELTETTESFAYLRYLDENSPIGDPSPDFLTVGTYPTFDAIGTLRSYARRQDAETTRIQDGGVAVEIPEAPTSVYFAYPDEQVQVEVFDPQPGRALELIESGVIRPVTGLSAATTTPTPAAPTTTTAAPTTTTTAPTTAPEGTPTIPTG